MKRYSLARRLTAFIISWTTACVVLLLRFTCRIRIHNDPRPELRATGKAYIYTVLHAHQIAAVIDGERGTGAMVSQSLDGEIIVPSLRVRGIVPVRGSGGRQSGIGRGGLAALEALIEHVLSGRPAYLAVDGPRGPRGRVQKGAAVLSRRTGAAILLMVAVPTRRWIFNKSWDRLQFPLPFSTIHGYFAAPLFPIEHETAEQYRLRIEHALHALEQIHDSDEAQYLAPNQTAA